MAFLVVAGLAILTLTGAEDPQDQEFEYATRIRPEALDDAELAKALDMAKAAGITTLDYEVDWEDTDLGDSGGNKRTYDWSELDRLLAGAEARGIKVSLLLTHTPDWVHPALVETEPNSSYRQWTAPKGETELQHWSNFVRDVVGRYKGRVVHYEIWNEPNHRSFWRPEPNPSEYAALLRAAYLSAKETDPQATIVFGGLSTNDLGYLKEYYRVVKGSYPDAASNRYFFDVLGVHPYSENRSPDRYTSGAIFQGKFGEVDVNFTGFRRMKICMEDEGDSGKSLLLSEFGYSTTDTWMKAVPDYRRALYLKRAYEIARETPYIEGLSWYTYHHHPEWALVNEDLAPNLTYRAYKQISGAEASDVQLTINLPERVSGTYTIEPQLTNLSGSDVWRWELYVDGSRYATQSTTPIIWDTSLIWNGRHRIMLAAYTTDGSVWHSNFATTTVDNVVESTIPAIADTRIVEYTPTSTFGNSSTIQVDGDDPGGTGEDKSGLIKWDLSKVPAGSKIISASVTLNVTNTSAQTYEAYELKRAWTESAASWNLFALDRPWEIAGAKGSLDRKATVAGSVKLSATGKQSFAISPEVVQGWVDNPATNRGIIIADEANTDGLTFYSRNAADATLRPELNVTYTAP